MPPPLLVRPPIEGRADLSSARSFLTFLCWLVEDRASYLSVPWTISFPCVAVVAKILKRGVKIVAQVCTLGENTGFSVEWGRVGRGDDAVDKLGGGCRAKRILSP